MKIQDRAKLDETIQAYARAYAKMVNSVHVDDKEWGPIQTACSKAEEDLRKMLNSLTEVG